MENLSRAENSPSKLINYFLRFHGWEFTKGHKLFETKISRMGIHQPFLRLEKIGRKLGKLELGKTGISSENCEN